MTLYFSGVQPTGNLHLGNYLGAIHNWINIQKDNNCLFCIMDLHAITVPQNPEELHTNIIKTSAMYFACGINEDSVFVQSTIAELTELMWVLSSITPIGWMNRMTQYKDKVKKNIDNSLIGLYTYPILMAADILLYSATHVPVGNDQKQHVEITRDIASAFNKRYNTQFFLLPEFVSGSIGNKIMSLRDGNSKMSKSDTSDLSRINIGDDEDAIIKKIQKAKTDPHPMPDSIELFETRPEIKNLITIMASCSGKAFDQIVSAYAGKNTSFFKKDLQEILIEKLKPIRENYQQLIQNREYIEQKLKICGTKAKAIASANMNAIRKIIGIY